MKRLFAILMAMMLLVAAAQAEATQSLEPDTEIAADLDGDGVKEHVSWKMAAIDDEYDPALLLTVRPEGGDPVSYQTDILWGESVILAKLDGSGATDILLTGDVMSDDYITCCLRWKDGALYPLLFADGGRGDNQAGCYYRYGYGLLKALESGRLELSGSQDVLGTWFGSRSYALTPAGYFDFADDGLWVRDIDPSDGDVWDYGALTLKASLPYADAEGHPAGILNAGEKILVTASDKQSRAWIATEDGRTGTLTIAANYEKGWGWLVNGAPEDDVFEYVPYAD